MKRIHKKIFFFFVFFISHITAHNTQANYYLAKSLLDQYERPFTLLELHADDDPCSLQIARNYDSVCVIATESNDLLTTCKNSNLTNIVLLNMLFTPEQLRHLGDCEHFDVILALNGLHACSQQWKKAFQAIEKLGDHLIIAISFSDNDAQKYILEKGGELLGEISTHNNEAFMVYHVALANNHLRRKTWLRSIMHKDNLYSIESSFKSKELIKPVSWPHGALKATPWIPGINLCTFKMCNGAYPASDQLKDALLAIKDEGHTDWLMNNMIVQGTRLALIDNDDPLSKRYFSETLFDVHKEMLDINDPKKIEHYFWNKLIKMPVSIRQTIKFMSQLFPAFSLVFDIGSDTPFLVDRYLGYGAKLVCAHPSAECADLIRKASMLESVYIENDLSLDALIDRYGKPRFCNIHRAADTVASYVKGLSKPIDCISHKFDVRYKQDLKVSLDHLTSLGYSQFNFSIMNIPSFVLEDNRYLGIHKEWAGSAEELLYEIDQFAQLAHNGETLSGYIYARYR